MIQFHKKKYLRTKTEIFITKKTTYFLNVITCASILLLMTVSVGAMHENQNEIHKQYALQAEEYNRNNPFLFNDTLKTILSHCHTIFENPIESLTLNINYFLMLRSICKKFNTLLSTEFISNICKNYTQDDKIKTLEYLINRTIKPRYKILRSTQCSILVHAVANPDIKCYSRPLLQKAIMYEDNELIVTLLKYNANPNVRNIVCNPVFFSIKKPEILEILLTNKEFNICATDSDGQNVLWHIINEDEYSAELMKLYLSHGVDPKQLDWNKSCLLHQLANLEFALFDINCTEELLKKAKLLLNAIPGMINIKNNDGHTPLDIALKSFEDIDESGDGKEEFEQLIKLYESYGAFTAKELAQQAALQRLASIEDKQSDCIVCLYPQENMINVPCDHGHPERICVECYIGLLATSDKCPICRNVLTK